MRRVHTDSATYPNYVPSVSTHRAPPPPLWTATHTCPTVQRTRIMYRACLRTAYAPPPTPLTCDPCIPYSATYPNFVPSVSIHRVSPPSSDLRPMYALQCELCTERVHAPGIFPPPPASDLRPMHVLQCNAPELCTERAYRPGISPTPLDCDPCIPYSATYQSFVPSVSIHRVSPPPSDLRPMYALQCNVPEFCTERVCAPRTPHPPPLTCDSCMPYSTTYRNFVPSVSAHRRSDVAILMASANATFAQAVEQLRRNTIVDPELRRWVNEVYYADDYALAKSRGCA